MRNPLSLKSWIDPARSADPVDVLVTKRTLTRFGHYKVPEYVRRNKAISRRSGAFPRRYHEAGRANH